MITEQDRRDYQTARTAIDETVRTYSPIVNENIQTLARIRAKKENIIVSAWLQSVADVDIAAEDVLEDLGSINDKLVKAYMYYFRLAFNFRFSLQMAQNINFRKILSFEYLAFHQYEVLKKRDDAHDPLLSTLKQDAKVFHLSPQAHYYAWRLLNEYSARIQLSDAAGLERFQRAYARVYVAFEAFASSWQSNPGADAFRRFFTQPAYGDVLQLIDHIDGRSPGSTTH